MRRRWILLVLVFAEAVASRPAVAQRDSADAEAGVSAAIVSGLSLQKREDLILGSFRPGQALGTVNVDVVEADGGFVSSRSANGGVALAASRFSAAQFSVTGPVGGPVHFAVVLPSSIMIQRVGGTETMTVDRFRSNVSPDCMPNLSGASCAASPYTLLVGATLHVDPKQAAGRYVGSFTVTVNQL